uniref:Uncharacterized protein n=1 Tax=Ditylenchus dipsaci TaxID=166011 RepID=A0A915EF28_9BILA
MECKGRGQLTPQSLIMESSKISCASTRLSESGFVNFQELQHAEKENASDVKNVRQSPRKQSRDSAELPAKIVDEEIEEEPAAEQEMDEEEEERRAVENIEEFNLY